MTQFDAVKAWISTPGEEVYKQGLDELQKYFGGRLEIIHGKGGRVVIIPTEADLDAFDLFISKPALGAPSFHEQSVYPDRL